jgi:hypothetical protein
LGPDAPFFLLLLPVMSSDHLRSLLTCTGG